MKKKNEGAQQALERGNFVLAKLTTFREAYPQVASLELEVTAFPMGFGQSENYYYSLTCPPGQYAPCPNPQCAGGGFNIGSFLSDLIHRNETEGEIQGGCVGRERLNRKHSRHCFYCFKAKAKLTYAEASPAGEDHDDD
ncbi:hypothetical protein [Luteolibacter sp. Populi]|uniref:hypothetical protein n=1 Tax=Luteolibacter sp. Populi TaxID=3230487 RepID=UPI0034659BAC